MKRIRLTKGLTLPIAGAPQQSIRPGAAISSIAVVGADYIGIKPQMAVKEGERVITGQVLFTDKFDTGIRCTAPGCGRVQAINRGDRRAFTSLVIELDGDESVIFPPTRIDRTTSQAEQIRALLINSGLWTSFRTRPYGRIPASSSSPASLFITAIDTSPLAADPQVVIAAASTDFHLGLQMLRQLLTTPIHYCTGADHLQAWEEVEGITPWSFSGPHPAGLPSTHIHFIDPVSEQKTVWHIDYQDVIAIGHLGRTGRLHTEQTIALAGPGVIAPALVTCRRGAALAEICRAALIDKPVRVISGSVLSGRASASQTAYLGRYDHQVSVLLEDNGRSLLNWAMPGSDRFSIKPVFLSALRQRLLPMNTALWGGKRAIYPLGTYEQVMPLDIIAIYLLKALAVGDTDKARDLGCLELIEEDLDLCGFVCPGKNEFGQLLRQALTTIESGG